LSAQHFGCRETRRAPADNDDSFRFSLGIGLALRFCTLALASHRDHPIAPLDVPARDRVGGGGLESLTGTQIKTGMMSRTADRAADYQALGEGAVIMRAMRRDGEDLLTCPHQENLLVANMTDERSLIRQIAEGYATGQVGAGRTQFILRHC